jgi:hypothetical protein
MFAGKLTKTEEKEIFFPTLFELFSTFLSSLFARLIRIPHINPLEFAF